MVEIVFHAPDIPTLAAAAAQMGFWDAENQTILDDGNIPGGGSWFYNFVGPVSVPTGATTTDANGNTVPVMQDLTGVYGRLRHNGDPQWLPTLPANSGITLYTYSADLGGWSADGVTLAPDYIKDIGVIA